MFGSISYDSGIIIQKVHNYTCILMLAHVLLEEIRVSGFMFISLIPLDSEFIFRVTNVYLLSFFGKWLWSFCQYALVVYFDISV